jgi:hypothetical protein
MPDLLTAAVGGLIGAGVAAVASYHFQNRLAANRRREQEQRIAYVRLVQISELIAVDDFLRKYMKTLFEVMHASGIDLREQIPKGEGYDRKHSIATAFAKAIEEDVNKEGGLSLSTLSGPLGAKAFTRMLEFSMAPSELADLPRDAVYAYSSFVTLAFNLRLSVEFIMQCLSASKVAPLTANFLLDTYETMVLMVEKAKELRAALLLRGGVSSEEATKLHAQQCQHFYRLSLLTQSNRTSNEIARKALESAGKR